MEPLRSEARERMLAAAEQLFAEKGYGPVTLRQIGAQDGLNHVEVMERIYARHRIGLTAAFAAAEPDVRAQCYAAARWLLAQPPMDLVRLEHIDMPELAPAQVQQLSNGAYTALQLPLVQVLSAASQRGEIAEHDFDLISGGLVGMIESLFAVSETVAGKPRLVMAERLIDVMLDGLRPRPS